jgi:hypothetical protein
VTDAQALGSQLQPLLRQKLGRPVVVYNFGQSKYGSTQERLLFEKLLLEGQKPDMAIFVDGLNDFQFTWGDEEFNWTDYVDSLLESKRFFARVRLDFQGIGVYPSDDFRTRASACCSPAGSSSG